MYTALANDRERVREKDNLKAGFMSELALALIDSDLKGIRECLL